MQSSIVWKQKVVDDLGKDLCVYDACFDPGGDHVIVSAGVNVHVYNAKDGKLLHSLKAHKDVVYSVSYSSNGKTFASGSADKNVYIWNHEFEAFRKYRRVRRDLMDVNHSDSVQCVRYSPVSNILASCSISEFTVWSPETKSVEKHKMDSRINCCEWNSTGTYLALGMANGKVSVRDMNSDERFLIGLDRSTSGMERTIWTLAWSPLRSSNKDLLCVPDWSGALNLYSSSGHVVSQERNIKTELLQIHYFRDGHFLLGGGCNKSVCLWSQNGASQLATLDSYDSWVWACVPSPRENSILVGLQDASLTLYEVNFPLLSHVHGEMVATRLHLNEVRVNNVLTDNEVSIKCSDCVEGMFIYQNKLGVQMNEKVVLYEIYHAETTGMHTRILKKIRHAPNVKLRGICSKHYLIEVDNRLQSYNFDGAMEREWTFQTRISCVQVIGGVPGRENVLVAVCNGLVMRLFLHIILTTELLNTDKYIEQLHLNENRDQLACVTNTRLLYVYSLGKESTQLYHEIHVDSVAWNSHVSDMFCYSSGSQLSIRTGTFPPHQQTFAGKVLCLFGSKLFVLKPDSEMELIQIALSIPMYQYLENTLYSQAYSLACLGVTPEDWKCLAMTCAENFQFDIALQCFRKLQSLHHIDLIMNHLNSPGKTDEREQCILLGNLLALDNRFKEAAKLFVKGDQAHRAVTMYSDLRMFDLAQEYLTMEGKNVNVDQKLLLKKKAEWAENINEPKTAADMYMSAGEMGKVIEIYAQQEWGDRLVQLARQMNTSERVHLLSIAQHLENLHKYDEAGEIYLKLGEREKIIKNHARAGQWEDALSLATGELKTEIYLNYAQWLAEHDQFIQAQRAFHDAGKTAQSLQVLTQMIDNAINECRFQDTSYYYWLLANQYLAIDLSQSHVYNQLANVYYTYNIVYKYCQEPFTSYKPDVLFNVSRYALFELKAMGSKKLKGISQFSILHTLIKQAKLLGANKFANQMLEKLSKLYCNSSNLRDTVDASIMNMKAKQYHDEEQVLIICYSCSTHVPLNSSVNSCLNCKQSFVYSFCTFEVLPLVEFTVKKRGDGDPEVVGLAKDQWTQEIEDSYEALQMQPLPDVDPFIAMEGSGLVQVDEETLNQMEPGTVIICKWPPPLQYRYYRNLLPEFPVLCCDTCFRMYHKEDFEMEKIQKGMCPFCRS